MQDSGRRRRCRSALLPHQASALTQRPRLSRLLSAKDVRGSLGIHEPVLYRTKYAYVTLVATDDFLPRALLLGWSLRGTGTTYDCIAMVLPEIRQITRKLLKNVYDRIVEVDSIKLDERTAKIRHLPDHEKAEYSQRMAKCNVFKLVEYEKILFIESSTYILRKIDELFHLQPPAGISSLVDSSGQTKCHGTLLSVDHTTKSLQMSRGIRGTLLLLAPSISLYHYCHAYKGRQSNAHFIRPDEEFLTKLFLSQWSHIHSKFASVPWQANMVRCDIYGVCLESFRPWKDDCILSEDIKQWRLNAFKMTQDLPVFKRVFRKMSWFVEIEEDQGNGP